MSGGGRGTRGTRRVRRGGHAAAAHGGVLADILVQVSGEAAQGEDLQAILQRIVDCLAARLPVAIASIILLDGDGGHFVQEVWAGRIDLAPPGALPWPVTVGAAGRCARSGRAQLIADVQRDPDYVPGHRDVRSEYLVPIRHRDRLHGVLNLESTQAGFFTADVRRMFDAVAAQIAGTIHLARVVLELEQANRKLQQLSMSDGLTGIANRRCFDEHLEEAWGRHARDRRWLALLLVDADCFKRLNDACGHLYGDECLREIARLCGEVFAGTEALVARYGGEEFAIVLPGADATAARRFGGRLCRQVRSRALVHPASPVAPCLTVSVGVAAVQPRATALPSSLIAVADRALYAAKAQGRDRVVARTAQGGRAELAT